MVDWDGAAYQSRVDALAAEGDMHGEANFVEAFAPLSVLDAGCGTGRVAIELARRGYAVVGVDNDASMLAVARERAPHLEWVHRDIGALDLGRAFEVVVMAGNVPLFTAAGTTAALVAGAARHLAPQGHLIAGFQLDRDYGTDQYDDEAARAGLTLTARFATWDRDPFHDGADYAVSVHQLAPEDEFGVGGDDYAVSVHQLARENEDEDEVGVAGADQDAAEPLDADFADAAAPTTLHDDARRERRAPICAWCGVTALPGSSVGVPADFACDNPDCAAYGEAIDG